MHHCAAGHKTKPPPHPPGFAELSVVRADSPLAQVLCNETHWNCESGFGRHGRSGSAPARLPHLRVSSPPRCRRPSYDARARGAVNPTPPVVEHRCRVVRRALRAISLALCLVTFTIHLSQLLSGHMSPASVYVVKLSALPYPPASVVVRYFGLCWPKTPTSPQSPQ